MQLRLSQLRQVAERTTEQERSGEALRRELRRTLGPSFVIEGRLADVALAANERLDELEFTGGVDSLGVRTSSLLRVAEHPSCEVRRLAARLLPEHMIGRFANDDDEGVRHAAAGRLSSRVIAEMIRRDPTDAVLRTALRRRCLREERETAPGARTGDVMKQDEGAELSDAYYESLAERLMQDYGRRLEFGWESAAVRRIAQSVKATSGVELDEERLLEALDNLREEREDAVLERPDTHIREAAQWLRRRAIQETPTMIPLLGEEDDDPVKALEHVGSDDPAFIDGVERVFAVKEAAVPPAVRKFRLGEGLSRPLSVPVAGRIPHGSAPRALDERVLDAYVRRWNDRAVIDGEPVKIAWSPSPYAADRIGFSVELR